MTECTGNARAGSAADPDWFSQAESQMNDLYSTLEEIGDESLLDALEELENQVRTIERVKGAEA